MTKHFRLKLKLIGKSTKDTKNIGPRIGGDTIDGYIKEYRSIIGHWVFQDAYSFKIWNYILCSAAYKEYKKTCKGELVTLYPGQLIYGRPEWSKKLGIPEGKLRSIIDLLEQDRMIQLKTIGRRYSVITIVNWEEYQGNDEEKDINEDSLPKNLTNEITNNEACNSNGLGIIEHQQNNQQITNRKPNKKNIKNIKNTYTTEFENFYNTYPRPEDKRRTFNNWMACLKTYLPNQLIQAAINYKNKKAGTDLQFLKSSANFLGKEKPFEDYIPKQPAEEKSTVVNTNNIEIPDYFLKANGYKEGDD